MTREQVVDAGEKRRNKEQEFRPMNITPLPGFSAMHRIVTPTCRVNKGDAACVVEVQEDVTKRLTDALTGWPQDTVKIHIAITIERLEP